MYFNVTLAILPLTMIDVIVSAAIHPSFSQLKADAVSRAPYTGERIRFLSAGHLGFIVSHGYFHRRDRTSREENIHRATEVAFSIKPGQKHIPPVSYAKFQSRESFSGHIQLAQDILKNVGFLGYSSTSTEYPLKMFGHEEERKCIFVSRVSTLVTGTQEELSISFVLGEKSGWEYVQIWHDSKNRVIRCELSRCLDELRENAGSKPSKSLWKNAIEDLVEENEIESVNFIGLLGSKVEIPALIVDDILSTNGLK